MKVVFDDVTGQVVGAGDVMPLEGQSSLEVRDFDLAKLGRVRAVKRGGAWDLEDMASPPSPPLGQVRAGAKAQIVAYADRITARITGQYPAAEVASWPTQEAEARAVKAGAAPSEAPLISALATAARQPIGAYADNVLTKAASYRLVVAEVKAFRDVAEAAIMASSSVAGVEQALVTARGEATALAVSTPGT